MPSPSGSTPVFGFPYPLETDAPDVPTWGEDLALALEAYFQKAQVPVGGVIDWFSDTLPTEGIWLFLHGGSVAEGSYPLLAAVYPSWVSGGNINLPDTRDRFLIGAAVSGDSAGPPVGSTGGSANVTLTTGMIPRFSGISVTLSGLAHSHGGVTGGESGHTHPENPNVAATTGSTVGLVATATNQAAFGTGISTGASTGHTHGVSSDSISGASGSVSFGSSSPTAVPTTPQYVAAHKIVRAG